MITYGEFLKRCRELNLPLKVYQQGEWEAQQLWRRPRESKLNEHEKQEAMARVAETAQEISAMKLSDAAQKLLRERPGEGIDPQVRT